MLSIADSVLEGLAPLRGRAVAPRIAFWSLCAWVFNVVSDLLLLVSFGLALPPTAPGAGGHRHQPGHGGALGARLCRRLSRVAKAGAAGLPAAPTTSLAFAMAVVLHVFGFLPLAVAGAVALVREGLSFSSCAGRPRDSPRGPARCRPH